MWIWYFIVLVVIAMALIQFVAKKRKEPFPGLKNILPSFSQETGQELAPKTQKYFEQVSHQKLPYFETILSLVEASPNQLVAEWSIDNTMKKELHDLWDNSQQVLRLYHLNSVPQPYYRDHKVDLEKGTTTININAPGETINCAIGLITETNSFISLAQSNDVIIPKEL